MRRVFTGPARPGDQAGAEWLAREAASLGATVAMETFRCTASIRWPAGSRPAASGSTACRCSTRRRPVPTASMARIAVVQLSPWVVYTPEYRAMRRASDRAGMVIVCQGGEPGLALLNAERFREPYGCPAIHVAEMPRARTHEAGEPLSAHRRRGPQCRGRPFRAGNIRA